MCLWTWNEGEKKPQTKPNQKNKTQTSSSIFGSATTCQSIIFIHCDIRWIKSVCCYVSTAVPITGSWPTVGVPGCCWPYPEWSLACQTKFTRNWMQQMKSELGPASIQNSLPDLFLHVTQCVKTVFGVLHSNFKISLKNYPFMLFSYCIHRGTKIRGNMAKYNFYNLLLCLHCQQENFNGHRVHLIQCSNMTDVLRVL